MKKLFILLLTALIFLGGAGLAFAQGYGVDIKNPLQSLAGNSKDLIVAISTYILNVIAGLGALVLIYAGILFVTSSGNESKLGSAKKAATWAVIGMAIGLGGPKLITIIDKIVNPPV